MKHMEEKSKSKKVKIIVAITIIVIILILAGILGLKIYKDKKNFQNINTETNTIAEENTIKPNEVVEPKEEKKEPEIFNGNDRPIAVMIDNHKGAWPQAGLNKTYLVYEIIVEGGETRLMALFKGQDVDVVGPVRSSRHYFLDYAMENDAIYAHYGWSPKAKSDISSLNINNINGLYYSKPTFWRVSTKKAPHNAMTSTSTILAAAKKSGYRTTSEQSSVLTYSQKEIELEDGEEATEIKIPHSYLHSVTYKYDEDTKRYTRYARGTLQKDYTTKEEVTTKNIIIMFANNSQLNDGTTKDRQDLSNIGTFDGYYITNGKAIEIKCKKENRRSKTIYTNAETGETLEVNDGNTWINICPKSAKVKIE